MKSKFNGLPKSAHAIAWKLQEFCEQNGISYRFNQAKGHTGRPNISIWFGGEHRKIAFSGSTTDQKAPYAAVRQLRFKLIEMGWTPPTNKTDVGEKEVQSENLFKNQKTSQGATSECVSINPKVVFGVEIPTKAPGVTPEDRNEAMLQAHEAGAKGPEIVKAAQAAGWRIESASGHLTRARNVREGLPARTNRRAPKPVEDGGKEKVLITVREKAEERQPLTKPDTRPALADDLAIDIAQAIAPIIGKALERNDAEIAALRKKADKFDALKNSLLGE